MGGCCCCARKSLIVCVSDSRAVVNSILYILPMLHLYRIDPTDSLQLLYPTSIQSLVLLLFSYLCRTFRVSVHLPILISRSSFSRTQCPRELEPDRFAPLGLAPSGFASSLFVDLDLNTSTPDTFRAPPTPLPYENSPVGKPLDTSTHECKSEGSPLDGPFSPKKPEAGDVLGGPQEEEETCAICLDEYDEENPKLETKCQHHFHLSCIMEWMERSDTCPMCDNVCAFGSS